jgi:hypothetical protein
VRFACVEEVRKKKEQGGEIRHMRIETNQQQNNNDNNDLNK